MNLRIFFCILPFVLSACTVIRDPETIPSGRELAQKSSKDESIELASKILKSIQNENYMEFEKIMSGHSDWKITEKAFRISCSTMDDQFGKITKFTYLLDLKTPLVRNQVWKVSFERKKERAKVEQEMLFRFVTSQQDGRTRIMGMGYF